MTKKMTSYQLTNAQADVVGAVVAERNRFLAQNDAALDELARMIAAKAGMLTDGGRLVFNQARPDAPVTLELVSEE